MTGTINMTTGKGLFKNLCLFIAPLMLTGILQLLYTASDLIICGSFGPAHSTAAISATNSLINMIVNTFLGFATGANVLMARCFGSEDKEKGQRVVYSSMILSVVLGIAVGAFGMLCSRYFLIWMSTPDDVIDLSTQYLAIYFAGVPFTMIYNFGAALLRAEGDTRKPFIFLTSSGVINILLNLLFVIVFKLGVAGVAICTAISQFCAAAMVVVYLLLKRNGFFHFKLSELRFYPRETLEIAHIGLPAGVQAFIFSLSNVMIQSSINVLGTDVMDGNGASASLEGFVYTAMNSCAQGAMTFASANYGAKKYKNISVVIIYSLLLVIGVWAVLSAAILLLRVPLLRLYISSPEAVEAGLQRLTVVLMTYFLCGFMDTFAYSLRAIGYSLLPTIISAVGACGFRLIWVFFIFPIPYFHNLLWLAISYPISWALTAGVQFAVFAVLYKKLQKNGPRPANGKGENGEEKEKEEKSGEVGNGGNGEPSAAANS